MKTDISFLPESKQEDLEYIVDYIKQEIDPLFIILFGSFARNEWVEDYQRNTEYVSDFDILVVTREKTISGIEQNEDRVLDKLKVPNTKNPASIIAHSLHYLNKKIEDRQYFFYDIYQEGVVLYNRDNLEIALPKELSIERRKRKAEEQFESFFETGEMFIENFEFSFGRSEEKFSFLKSAAFQLHQAVENIYASILLCYTDYRPKFHDLKKLEKEVVKADQIFLEVFPRETAFQKASFEKLREAYIKARYSPKYEITKEQLIYLKDRVKLLRDLAKENCKMKIESFIKAASN